MQADTRWAHARLRIVVLDLVAVVVAHLSAYLLRFDGWPDPAYSHGLLLSLPVFAACAATGLVLSGTYRMDLEFAGIEELLVLAKAAGLAGLAFVLLSFLLQLPFVPRSVVLMDVGLVFLLTSGIRFAPHLLHEIGRRESDGLRVLVLGAGSAGETITREMLRHPQLGYEPVGFVDDSPQRWNTQIHGVPVLGGSENLPRLVRHHRVDEIIIAVPTATGAQMRHLVERCQTAGVPFRTVPGIREILDGRVRVQSVREVRIEDLLGRSVVQIDPHEVRAFLSGKRVLVTGAAGSIGSELCRQILSYAPAKLVLLDRNENGMFHLERELQGLAPEERLEVAICDITNAVQLTSVVCRTAPQVLFHTAAYKHVPLMERHPVEAVHNNVFGSLNVLNAAESCGVDSFVLISTDKAVAPSSVMGATKRLAGLIVQNRALESHTRCVTVRFGNVLGSEGSVLDIFRQQIARGGPVTVTSPQMKRFFMTIPEAVQLISQAATMGRGGEIFILDMGEPVSIDEMARQMIRLSGLEPDRDIEVRYVGPRPGERLEERLWSDWERPVRTFHPQILSAQSVPIDRRTLREGLERLDLAVANGEDAAIIRCLRELVPDYVPNGEACGTSLVPAQSDDPSTLEDVA